MEQFTGLCCFTSRTINTFKARLDKLWENQNVRYTWKADISFTDTCVKILSHRQHVLISRHSVCAIKEHLHIHSSMAKLCRKAYFQHTLNFIASKPKSEITVVYHGTTIVYHSILWYNQTPAWYYHSVPWYTMVIHAIAWYYHGSTMLQYDNQHHVVLCYYYVVSQYSMVVLWYIMVHYGTIKAQYD